jgi:hypothetical protein
MTERRMSRNRIMAGEGEDNRREWEENRGE